MTVEMVPGKVRAATVPPFITGKVVLWKFILGYFKLLWYLVS